MTLELPKIKLAPQDTAALDQWFAEAFTYGDIGDEFKQRFMNATEREIDSLVQRAFAMGFTYGVNFEKNTKS